MKCRGGSRAAVRAALLSATASGRRARGPYTRVVSAATHTAMLIHSALFWLRKDLTPAERDTFAAEVRRLAQIPYLERGFAGTPAQTEHRAVTDHSLDFATSLHFESLEGHDFCQRKCEHHARFVAACSAMWERVVICDIAPLG